METLKYNLSLPALFPSSDRSTTGYLLSQNEVSSFGSGLHPIELFTKGVPWGAQKNWDSCQVYNRLLYSNWRPDPIAENNTHTNHLTWKNWAGY